MRRFSLASVALLGGSAVAAEFAPRHMFVASYSEAVFEYDESGVLVRTLPTGNAIDVAFGPRGHLFVSRAINVIELDADMTTRPLVVPPRAL